MIREVITVEGRDQASAAFDKTGGSFDSLTSKIGSFAKGAIATAAAAKIAQLGAQMVGMAVDAGEAASAFETTFGDGVDAASQFVDEFANKAGFARYELQQMLATSGNVAQGIGATEEQSAALAEQMARLAGDVASFSNASGGAEAVLAALQSALTGEREALKTYGIAVSQAEVEERALADTRKASADDLTRLELANATMTIATEKAGKAVGDLDRTSDSAANRMREIKAEIKETGTAAGQELLPALEDVLPVVSDMIPLLADAAVEAAGLATALGPLAKGLLTVLTPALSGVSWWLDTVQQGFTDIAAALGSEADKSIARMGEAVDYLSDSLAKNEDPAVALANALDHVASNAQLTSGQFDELARMSGLTEDEIRNVQVMLLTYAQSAEGARYGTKEMQDAFGEAIVVGDEYVDAAERMARQTRYVSDAASGVAAAVGGEAAPALGGMTEEMVAAEDAAKKAAEALRKDLAGEMAAFASGVEGATDLAEVSLDEFFGNFEERHAQQQTFWANLAILYSAGLTDLADELREGGVTNAGLAEDATSDMAEAARLDEMIGNAKADIGRWSDAIGDEIDATAPRQLQRMRTFGADMGRSTAEGFEAFDLGGRLDAAIAAAVRAQNVRKLTTGGLLGVGGYADGGIVPGAVGQPMPAVVHGGEEVFSVGDRRDMIDAINRLAAGGGGGGDVNVRIVLEGGRDDVARVETEAQSMSLAATVERLVR